MSLLILVASTVQVLKSHAKAQRKYLKLNFAPLREIYISVVVSSCLRNFSGLAFFKNQTGQLLRFKIFFDIDDLAFGHAAEPSFLMSSEPACPDFDLFDHFFFGFIAI